MTIAIEHHAGFIDFVLQIKPNVRMSKVIWFLYYNVEICLTIELRRN